MKGPAKLLLLSFTVALMCTLAVTVLQMQPGDVDTETKYISVQSLYYPTSITALERNTFIETAYATSPNTPSASSNTVSPDMPKDVAQYATMPMEKRWALLSGGKWSTNPEYVYSVGDANWNIVEGMRAQMEVRLTVKVWQYKNDNPNNYETELRSVSFLTNKALVPCLTQIFKEMESTAYSMYPLYISDKGYSVRNVKGTAKYSKHSFGGALDVNASSVAGGYSNKYSSTIPYCSDANWNTIPQSKEKYKVFYESHPLVLTFKKYGWCWGGDWDGKRDGMHFGYLGG